MGDTNRTSRGLVPETMGNTTKRDMSCCSEGSRNKLYSEIRKRQTRPRSTPISKSAETSKKSPPSLSGMITVMTTFTFSYAVRKVRKKKFVKFSETTMKEQLVDAPSVHFSR